MRSLSLQLRRIAVTLLYIGAISMNVIPLLNLDNLSFVILFLMSFILFVTSLTYLLYKTGLKQLYFGKEEDLDERQMAVKNYGYRRAYFLILIIMASWVIYLSVASGFQGMIPATLEIGDFIILLILISSTLPFAIIAWKEPEI